MRTRLIATAALALLAAGCSPSTAAPAGQPLAGATAATTQAAPATTRPTGLDAAALIAIFKRAGLPVGATVTFTASTDPNHLLGRPGGYTSKASWSDTRVKASDAQDSAPGAVDLGGSIEVYPDVAGAQARAKYVQDVYSAAPMLASEYVYVAGTAVIRVTGLLTPDQAAEYKTAAGG